jgi:polyphosphate glucokinase
VVNGTVVPMELGQLSYRGGTYESYLGLNGLKRLGISKWRDAVHDVVARFFSALEVDDVVIGGGNVNKMDKMPPGCRAGDNAHAFRGGILLWNENGGVRSSSRQVTRRRSRP